MPGGNIHAPAGLVDVTATIDIPNVGYKVELRAPGEDVYATVNNLTDGGTTGVTVKVTDLGVVEVYFTRGGVADIAPTLQEYAAGKWRAVLAAEA